jgi:hypothetical protein
VAQPLYFLPGVSMTRDTTIAAKRQILQTAGLADIFADVKQEGIGFAEVLGKGPGDKSGVIVYYVDNREVPPRCGYFAGQQTWHPIDDGSVLWIGLHNDYPPRPADMKRAKVHNGYEMELADGNEWQIPIIRRPSDMATALPQTQYIEGGKLVKKLKAAYQKFWDNSEVVADFFLAKKPLSELRAHELAVEAIGLNYRFGPNEQKILGLVDSENYGGVLCYTIDLPHVQAQSDIDSQKKTDPLAAESLNT